MGPRVLIPLSNQAILFFRVLALFSASKFFPVIHPSTKPPGYFHGAKEMRGREREKKNKGFVEENEPLVVS